MRIPGHTIQLGIKTTCMETCITIECSCGAVLAKGIFAVDDPINRQAVMKE